MGGVESGAGGQEWGPPPEPADAPCPGLGTGQQREVRPAVPGTDPGPCSNAAAVTLTKQPAFCLKEVVLVSVFTRKEKL